MSAERVISVIRSVFRVLGPGHSESVYKNAVLQTLARKNVSYRTEVICPYFFEGGCIGYGRADIVTDDAVFELKVAARTSPAWMQQVRKYTAALKTVEKKSLLPVVVNFGASSGELEVEGMAQKQREESVGKNSDAWCVFAQRYKLTSQSKQGILEGRVRRYMMRHGVGKRELESFLQRHFTCKMMSKVAKQRPGSAARKREAVLFPKDGLGVVLRA